MVFKTDVLNFALCFLKKNECVFVFGITYLRLRLAVRILEFASWGSKRFPQLTTPNFLPHYEFSYLTCTFWL